MGTQMLMLTVLNYFNTVLLLHMLSYAIASSNTGHSFADSTQYPYENIFTPLLKALSDHGETRWNAELKKSVKPEHKYMKYMVEVHKKSSRAQRSLDTKSLYNTLRLIKPLEKCLNQKNEVSTQHLSYKLDRVLDRERLLKSILLYSFDRDPADPIPLACNLDIKEREDADQCPLCPSGHQMNFTVRRAPEARGKNWVEVDVTSLLLPLFKINKRTVNLLVNLTCSDGRGPPGEGWSMAALYPLWSPALLLYLNDTNKSAPRTPPGFSVAGQRLQTYMPPPTTFKLQEKLRHQGRRRRASPKTKRAGQSLDLHLPELRPSLEFPTSDCALYDFKVRFSQLKLDHWIVFPPKYNPRYCRGTCPTTLRFIYGSPIHTIMQNFMYEKPDAKVPRPACIPSHYSPLSVMIFEEDGSYVYKQFDEMVATRCTCR